MKQMTRRGDGTRSTSYKKKSLHDFFFSWFCMGYDVYTEAQESLTERNSRNTAVEVEQADKGKGTN